jgi:hypothetical protein
LPPVDCMWSGSLLLFHYKRVDLVFSIKTIIM